MARNHIEVEILVPINLVALQCPGLLILGPQFQIDINSLVLPIALHTPDLDYQLAACHYLILIEDLFLLLLLQLLNYYLFLIVLVFDVLF